MCIATAAFVGNDTLVKLAGAEGVPTTQIMAMRGVGAVLVFSCVIAAMRQTGGARTLRHPLVILRGAIDAGVALCFMSALPLMQIADLTAIAMASPVIITLLSALLLKEKVGWRRWLAVGMGFAGMLLVVRPGASSFQIAGLLGLLSAVGVACRDLITRRLPPDLSTGYIGLTTTLSTMMLGFVLLPLSPAWQIPGAAATACLAGSAILLVVGNFLVTLAFRQAEISVVVPFRYASVLFAILTGYLAFGDLPDLIAACGVMLIVAAGLYTLHRERVRLRAGL